MHLTALLVVTPNAGPIMTQLERSLRDGKMGRHPINRAAWVHYATRSQSHPFNRVRKELFEICIACQGTYNSNMRGLGLVGKMKVHSLALLIFWCRIGISWIVWVGCKMRSRGITDLSGVTPIMRSVHESVLVVTLKKRRTPRVLVGEFLSTPQ